MTGERHIYSVIPGYARPNTSLTMIEGEQSPIADLFELSNYLFIYLFFNRQCQDLDLMALETFPTVSICTYFLDTTQHELKHYYVISLACIYLLVVL